MDRTVKFKIERRFFAKFSDWLDRNQDLGNPFAGCNVVEFHAQMNYNSSYTDMMIYIDAEYGPDNEGEKENHTGHYD